jgi:hypothetical protein
MSTKRIVRVNTHPRPINADYDYHIPYIGNVYNQKEHVADQYLLDFTKQIDTNATIYLVGCGEPSTRNIVAKQCIKSKYHDVIIDPITNSYTNNDPLFTDVYATIPRPTDFDVDKLAKQYLEYFTILPKFSQRYNYEFHSRDHGYFAAGKRYWYQYGEDMPLPPSAEHENLYKKFSQIFDQLVDTLLPSMKMIGLNESKLRSKLLLRLSHNPPGARINNLVVTRHVDASIVTAWIYQDQLGAYIDYGQEVEESAVPIETVHDSGKEILLLPGLDYCDQTSSSTPATFHQVREIVVDHRVSLVAFVRY